MQLYDYTRFPSGSEAYRRGQFLAELEWDRAEMMERFRELPPEPTAPRPTPVNPDEERRIHEAHIAAQHAKFDARYAD